jgi:hypothetical protein
MPATQHAKINVPSFKLTVPLRGDALPRDLVPPEPEPAGSPVLDVALEGGALVARARLNGKSVRKALKVVAEHGTENVVLVLQGALKPPAAPGEPYHLEGAGLTATVKAPRPPVEE